MGALSEAFARDPALEIALEKGLREVLAPPLGEGRSDAIRKLIELTLKLIPGICERCLGAGQERTYTDDPNGPQWVCCELCQGRGSIDFVLRLEHELREATKRRDRYREYLAEGEVEIAQIEAQLVTARATRAPTGT